LFAEGLKFDVQELSSSSTQLMSINEAEESISPSGGVHTLPAHASVQFAPM